MTYFLYKKVSKVTKDAFSSILNNFKQITSHELFSECLRFDIVNYFYSPIKLKTSRDNKRNKLQRELIIYNNFILNYIV